MRTWSKIKIVIGSLLILGALHGVVQLASSSGWGDKEFAEQFRTFAVSAGIVCAIQFAAGATLVWFGVRSFRTSSGLPLN